MPKKHRKTITPRPRNTVHPSLQTFSSSRAQNGHVASGNRGVNDILQHLRSTQISREDAGTPVHSPNATPGSVHPSIRNALALPEPPAPRPRTVQRVGGRRIRRTPGPAPPTSWLLNNSADESPRDGDLTLIGDVSGEKRLQLDRLPGVVIPPAQSLQHAVLKAMALNWDWHLVYDHAFLSELPTGVRVLLLSYVGVYTDHASMQVGMQGLKPLFLGTHEDGTVNSHSDVTRLDLSCALGRWTSLKQIRQELIGGDQPVDHDPSEDSASIPLSWDEEPLETPPTIPRLAPKQPSRFENLTYLSLANPAPAGANWNSLVRLLEHLSTLTHLSLAYWPAPTTSSTFVVSSGTNPGSTKPLATQHTLSSTSSKFDETQAASVLRRLSRTTYCLKWLDLEGCSEWLSALAPNNGDQTSPTWGPEWNGSWRGIEWIGLGPGWFPDLSDETSYLLYEADEIADRRERVQQPANRLVPRDAFPTSGGDSSDSDAAVDNSARQQARRRQERNVYRSLIGRAVRVRNAVRDIRRVAGGRWVDVSLGPESNDERGRVCGIL